MKKFNLRRLTSLCIASVLTVTLSSCSKMNKNGEQEETAAIYTTDNLNEREHIYDETVTFTKPLSEYAFTYFPKTGRSDVALENILEAYDISYEDFLNLFVRRICGDNILDIYEEAYALTTVALNRLLHNNEFFGNTLIEVITNPQYDMTSKEYLELDSTTFENYASWQAIIDCLANFAEDPTNRMHNSLYYRWPEYVTYSDYQFTENSNRYDDKNLLTIDQITYPNISLNSSKTLRP